MSPIQITIKDYKAVKSAEIELNGITVISGVNGAGKSSISRLLYYALKYANNYDTIVNRLFADELLQIDRLIQSSISGVPQNELTRQIQSQQRIAASSNDNSIKKEAYINAIRLIMELFHNLKKKDANELHMPDPAALRIMSLVYSIGDNRKNKSLVMKGGGWDAVINSIEASFEKANRISLTREYPLFRDAITNVLNDDLKSVRISEYGVPFVGKGVTNVPILNFIQQSVYIDTPMIAGLDMRNGTFPNVEYWDDLNVMLSKPAKKSYSRTINNYIKDVTGGNAYIDYGLSANGTMKYQREDGLEIDLADSATGIKSLSMLQALLRNGSITENTLLIIDEPEAHLHPQWIVEYARIIVMMHQKIGAKFFIASHSTDFVSAIKYITEKQKVDKSLSFYLAEEDKRKPYSYNYKAIGTDIEPIFESFNKSLDKISEYGGW